METSHGLPALSKKSGKEFLTIRAVKEITHEMIVAAKPSVPTVKNVIWMGQLLGIGVVSVAGLAGLTLCVSYLDKIMPGFIHFASTAGFVGLLSLCLFLGAHNIGKAAFAKINAKKEEIIRRGF